MQDPGHEYDGFSQSEYFTYRSRFNTMVNPRLKCPQGISFKPHGIAQVGRGENCFMNVIMQILVGMDPLYNALMRVQWIWARLLLLDT